MRILLSALCVLVLNLSVETTHAQSFTETEITTLGDYYGLSSAMHDDGLALSHYAFSGALLFSSRGAGAFSTMTVAVSQAASPPDSGSETALVFDTDGSPHIFYHLAGSGDLMHAYQSSGSWTVETVDSSGSVGTYAQAIRCAGNQLCVCYQDTGSADLKFAKGTAGSWTIEAAESSADDLGISCSLAEKADGSIIVAHYNDSQRQLEVSIRSSAGSWHSETLTHINEYGMWPSVAIDTDGSVEIYASAYKNNDTASSDNGLYLAQRADGAGAWTISSAENSSVGGHPAAIFTSEGKYRVVYRYLYAGGLFPAAGFMRLLSETDEGGSALVNVGTAPFCYPRYRSISMHENSTGLLSITAARDQNGSCSYGVVVFEQDTPTPTPTASPSPTASPTPEATATPSPSPVPTMTPESEPVPAILCSLQIRFNRRLRTHLFKVYLEANSLPVARAQFRIESRQPGRKFKVISRGKTGVAGRASKRLPRQRNTRYRVKFPAQNCSANPG